MTTIYTAGPIDLATVKSNWRDVLRSELDILKHPCVLFDPLTAFKCSVWGTPDTDRAQYIEQVNNSAIEMADLFVAFIPKSQFSMGVPIEVDLASRLDKPTVVITDIPRGKSAYLDNRVAPAYHIQVDNMDDESVHMACVKLAVMIKEMWGTGDAELP